MSTFPLQVMHRMKFPTFLPQKKAGSTRLLTFRKLLFEIPLQIAVLAVVALVLGLFVLRPLLLGSGSRRAVGLPAPDTPLALPGMSVVPVLTGQIDGEAGLSAPGSVTEDDPVNRLRRLIVDRQTESVEILRGWMELEEERG